jgi:hypothetical protein
MTSIYIAAHAAEIGDKNEKLQQASRIYHHSNDNGIIGNGMRKS